MTFLSSLVRISFFQSRFLTFSTKVIPGCQEQERTSVYSSVQVHACVYVHMHTHAYTHRPARLIDGSGLQRESSLNTNRKFTDRWYLPFDSGSQPWEGWTQTCWESALATSSGASERGGLWSHPGEHGHCTKGLWLMRARTLTGAQAWGEQTSTPACTGVCWRRKCFASIKNSCFPGSSNWPSDTSS